MLFIKLLIAVSCLKIIVYFVIRLNSKNVRGILEKKTVPDSLREKSVPDSLREKTVPDIPEEKSVPGIPGEKAVPGILEETTVPDSLGKKNVPDMPEYKSVPGSLEKRGGRTGPLSVDIILPMYNEETVVARTVENLLEIDYEKFSVIVIDDGSTDDSYNVVDSHFRDNPRVRLVHQPNEGKSTALNRGMSESQSDIVISIDADTMVRRDVIDRILPYFEDPCVAAVSGYVKVGNRVNLLTDMQYMEYLTIQNQDRAVFDSINGILVVPGALGAFRRLAVEEVGGFKADALAEDCDITLRLLCQQYKVRNAARAVAFTEAPSTAKMFLKQRVRWTVGLVQGLLKHNKELFFHRNKALAYIVMPYTWIYRVILPVFIPLSDYFFIYFYFIAGRHEILKYYLLFVGIEVLTSIFILTKIKELFNFIKLVTLQRFLRHLTLLTYLSIMFRWISGNLYGWGKIPRRGSVKVD